MVTPTWLYNDASVLVKILFTILKTSIEKAINAIVKYDNIMNTEYLINNHI